MDLVGVGAAIDLRVGLRVTLREVGLPLIHEITGLNPMAEFLVQL